MQLLPGWQLVKHGNEIVPIVMTKSICLDSYNLSLCIRNQSLIWPKLKKKKQGATIFYFLIKIGYIVPSLIVFLPRDTKGHIS